MPDPTEPFWWPLDLSPRAHDALEAFRHRLRTEGTPPDPESLQHAADLLEHTMRRHVDQVLERDGLPHFCHLINGWGDGTAAHMPLTSRLQRFVHRDAEGRPILLQCDPEGDFHPWQTLAYLVMAGVEPDVTLYLDGPTLRELAQNSRSIDLEPDQGHELGHLLFALSWLDPDPNGRPFSFRGTLRTIPELVDMAVEAHHYGSFDVCRKFHLTEGLCAAAVRLPGFENRREEAQGFLDGQMDMLLLTGLILEESRRWIDRKESPPEDSLLRELRDTLVMGLYVENHYYYAGHIVELAGFAEDLGFELAPEHRAAVCYVTRELNRLLPSYLPHLAFLECFLHLGHYRRALTLELVLDEARRDGRRLTRADLRRFAVDFDDPDETVAETLPTTPPEPPGLELQIYRVAPAPGGMRPELKAVLARYTETAEPGFEPRGGFDHFRRILPPDWPRAFHYEVLDYDGPVGVEIHLESKAVTPLADRVRELLPRLREHFPACRVEWDPEWWNRCGRLRVLFEEGTPSRTVAAGLDELIGTTFPALDPGARRLRIAPP